MSFFGHRNNFRAWAVGPSQPLREEGQRQLLEEYVGPLYPMQTVFWRPNRSDTGVRTAFGMEYPVLHRPQKAPGPEQDVSSEQGEHRRANVSSLPDTCEQRLSVYIQLKKRTLKPQDPPEPDLGLDENTIVILDSMRKNPTSEELLDGLIPWTSLMYNADVEDPLVGNPVLIAAIRLIFDAVAAKWSDYILSWLNYVAALEERIYIRPADDKYSPLLWESSKRLQQAERLLKFHVLLIENVQHELTDITGPNTMEPDWLRQNLKEFSRLSSEVEESLRKPVAQMVDLVNHQIADYLHSIWIDIFSVQMYKSIGIRDARQSLELNTSLFRLSWITFIFLPLTFLAGIFGMNVSEMHSNPPLKW